MSLLVDMMTNTLDGSYADAAARRAGKERLATERGNRVAAPSPQRRVLAVVLLLLLGGVTGTASAQVRRGDSAARTARIQLLQDVRDETRNTDDLSRRAQDLRLAVGVLRDTALGAGSAGRLQAERLAELNLVTGGVPVRGPGIVLTLDDAKGATGRPAARGGDVQRGRVQDRDLQDVVNGLWAAGAEAISINGLRLTALTAIRSAGEAILVDFRPLSPPYAIRAVGDRNGLQSGFGSGAAGGRLAALASLVHVRYFVMGADDLHLAAAGLPDLRLAQPGSSS